MPNNPCNGFHVWQTVLARISWFNRLCVFFRTASPESRNHFGERMIPQPTFDGDLAIASKTNHRTMCSTCAVGKFATTFTAFHFGRYIEATSVATRIRMYLFFNVCHSAFCWKPFGYVVFALFGVPPRSCCWTREMGCAQCAAHMGSQALLADSGPR